MISRNAYRFCRKGDIEKVENYELALNSPKREYVIHHRLELTLDGQFAHTPEELIRLGMYYNRPYYELIFLKMSDHFSIHTSARNPMGDAKNREKLSRSKKGNTYNFGKHLSEEHRKKLSESHKGLFDGAKNPMWQGDNASPKAKKLREWRKKRRELGLR